MNDQPQATTVTGHVGSRTRERLADTITDLTDPYTTGETVDRLEQRNGRWRKTHARHVVHHPSLLDQLRAATTSPTLTAGDAYRSIPGSKPSARLDAIRALQTIEIESLQWAQVLRSRTRATVEDRLRGLVGAVDTGERDARGRTLTAAARSWLATARVVTGWDAPPFAPDVPCPEASCERRGGLRIRLDSGTGVCTECGTYWDADTITGLAQYVQWAAEHLRGPEHLVLDAAGEELVKCPDCDVVRQEMDHRRRLRANGERVDTRVSA